MIRLNLCSGNPADASYHPIEDSRFVNLDKATGWCLEDGLPNHETGSVEGVTISHGMMYLALDRWPAFWSEIARVLVDDGIVRVTEDHCTHPESRVYPNGWHGSYPRVTLTDPQMVRSHMEAAGLFVRDVTADETHFVDRTLMQAQHHPWPHSFWIEGQRKASLLFAPHHDDESLFGAFTIIRHRPNIIICYPSDGAYGETETRLAESRAAAAILGGGMVEQWNGGDLVTQMRAADARLRPTRVFAPSPYASHSEHEAVARAAEQVFGDRLIEYQTYNQNGKVRSGDLVPFEPDWLRRKRMALDCYRSQIEHPRAKMFFNEAMFDMAEYVVG